MSNKIQYSKVPTLEQISLIIEAHSSLILSDTFLSFSKDVKSRILFRLKETIALQSKLSNFAQVTPN